MLFKVSDMPGLGAIDRQVAEEAKLRGCRVKEGMG